MAMGRKGITDIAVSGGMELFIGGLKARYGSIPKEDSGRFTEAFRQLDVYFSGVPFDFDLPLAPFGTPFELSVWKALKKIPWGKTRSYGEIAGEVGSPRGGRAVGKACGANPIPVIIPCHRVVRANGDLGGYAGGIEVKKALLEIEGKAI